MQDPSNTNLHRELERVILFNSMLMKRYVCEAVSQYLTGEDEEIDEAICDEGSQDNLSMEELICVLDSSIVIQGESSISVPTSRRRYPPHQKIIYPKRQKRPIPHRYHHRRY